MAYTIAFAGKGGTGKTSLASLTIKYLIKKRRGPILAIDADSNSCLNEALGVEVHTTIGKLREESLETVREKGERPGGLSMEQLFDYPVQQALIEAKGFDLLVMGRPEGPGCYCAANHIIRKYTDQLSENYPYVVIDNEAGMEHLSRRTTNKVNLLLIISDPTFKGILSAKRIMELIIELNLEIDRNYLIINRLQGNELEELKKLSEDLGLTLAGAIPQDDLIFKFELSGKPIFELPENSLSVQAYWKVLDTLNIPFV
ncbi:MAG: carbon monoxide dehydrogenase [Thermodesulfovibrionales bacterium]|nr:carbon monoxide dehydrogenase [Thermodesulfovibrionales bacterium]